MRIELTENQLFEIVSRVITALQTNSKAINELTLVTVVSSDDYIELSEGKRIAVNTIVNRVREYFGPGSVTTGMLQNLCVTTAKVANAAITTEKLASGSVTLAKLASSVFGTITSGNTGLVTGGAVYQAIVDVSLWERGTGSNSVKQKGGTNIVSGKFSVAEGDLQMVSGKYAHAEGYGNNVSRNYGHGEGMQTVVGGNAAHAEGCMTKAYGNQSHAEGIYTDSGKMNFADNSHAEGFASGALGIASHAEGGYGCATTVSSGDKRVAVVLSGAAGATSFTVDNFSNLDMDVSLLAGKKILFASDETTEVNVRISSASLSGGVCTINTAVALSDSALSGATFYLAGNTASGANAHAEGNFNVARGTNSHAEGHNNAASGANSHAEGEGTMASQPNEHAQGQYNRSRSNLIHSIGVGTGNDDRLNGEEMDADGKKFLKGVGGYNGANGGASGVRDVAQTINGAYALVGYAVCDSAASSSTKSVTIANFPNPTAFVGGSFKVKMTYGNTSTSAVKLAVNGTAAINMRYNGKVISPLNSWAAGEVLEVWYDGTYYQAVNVQGSGEGGSGGGGGFDSVVFLPVTKTQVAAMQDPT